MSCTHRPVDDACLFCKIIAGTIPCAKVYEDDHILAFLDISPAAEGHTLVVPKGHYPTLLDVPVCLGAPLLQALQRVAAAVQQATGAEGFNCIQNNFSAAGQMVFHSHWHVIPRADGDGLRAWPGRSYSDGEAMQKLAMSVNSRIADGLTGGEHER